MLIDFSFRNYRSFRDEQAFSMERDERDATEGADISPVSAVYGANASGKSNFLKAFEAMQRMVVSSYREGDVNSGVPQEPFRLDRHSREEATEFYVEFLGQDGLRYRYSFACDSQVIVSEELRRYNVIDGRPSTRSALLFRRDGQDVSYGAAFKGARAQIKELVAKRPNALMLSVCAAVGVEVTQPVFDFFSVQIRYYVAAGFKSEERRILNELAAGSAFAKHLSQLVRYADFGIDDIELEKVDLLPMFAQLQQTQPELFEEGGDLHGLLEGGPALHLLFRHGGDTGAALGAEEESDGTRAALSFFSMALINLAGPTVTLVDEIDTSLHPKFVEELVELYTDPMTNPHGAQLIFTTHDVSLINVPASGHHVLAPDQVWFVEKGPDGSSELFPATDMGLRKGENIGKNYLNGVYGAAPKPAFHDVFAQIMAQEAA
ncbi:AAA family ATPase [Bifidobacterium cuniculi]|uniref:ATPase AAA-type core domain-containing protein n=1 Tax=Bifidobacterium cuniculi TaxID=1688 RepID=A0A087AWP2_9BIFI|nr:ATP-binding protein [Bifidobacterium cuniculi]KFI63192.1 hypothetical protein BCUN_1118 [Bifidobacterium cuniculi]